jgi:hypothetical protein
MAISTSYSWKLSALANPEIIFVPSADLGAAAMQGGGYVVVGSHVSLFGTGSTNIYFGAGDGGLVASATVIDQPTRPYSAGLANGNAVVAYAFSDPFFPGSDPTSVAIKIYSPTGSLVLGQTPVGNVGSAAVDVPTDIANLANAGFALALQDQVAPGQHDLFLNIYSTAGVLQHQVAIDVTTIDRFAPQVVGLDNGNVAVAFLQSNGGIAALYTAVYSPTGAAIQAPTQATVLSSVPSDLSLVAMAGGFALVSGNAGGSSADISLFRFNTSGQMLGVSTIGSPGFADVEPEIVRLSGGKLAVTWVAHNLSTFTSDVHLALVDNLTGSVLADFQSILWHDPELPFLFNPPIASTLVANGLSSVILASELVQMGASGGINFFEGLSAVRDLAGDGLNNSIKALGDMDHHLIGNGGNDALTGHIGDDVIDGGIGNDKLKGDVGGDVLNGGDGNDLHDGGAGDDTMTGGLGNDTYIVDNPLDAVIELADGGTDTVKTSISLTLADHVEKLLLLAGFGDLGGIGNSLANVITGNEGDNLLQGLAGEDNIKGNDGDDTLDGGEGDDALNGGDDDDLLIGGLGADVLTGGAGADAFRLDVFQSGVKDSIKGFVHGSDRIEIDSSAFSAFASDPLGLLDPSAFHLGLAAQTASQHLIYNAAKGALYYDVDGAGGMAQVQIATFSGSPFLDQTDILIV